MKLPKLSILDLAYFTEGDESATQVLKNSTEVAQLADELGYTRYWFAEHHNTGFLMSIFPEIMMAHVAANTNEFCRKWRCNASKSQCTKRCRTFSMLEALHPGRIDEYRKSSGYGWGTAYALRRRGM